HLPHHEEPEADDQQHRQEVDQQSPEGDPRLGRRLVDGDAVVDQVVHQALVAARRGGDALAAVGAGELDRTLVAGDVHFLDPVAADVGDELRVDDLVAAACGFRAEALEYHHQHDGDNHPKHQILDQVIHSIALRGNAANLT